MAVIEYFVSKSFHLSSIYCHHFHASLKHMPRILWQRMRTQLTFADILRSSC